MSVNKPTDVKQKEADVNRKLQIYGIINAFQAGKVPSVRTPCANHSGLHAAQRTDSRCAYRMTKLMSL